MADYMMFAYPDDKMIEMCGTTALTKLLNDTVKKKTKYPLESMEAYEDADMEYQTDMWENFENNWEGLLGGFNCKTAKEMTYLAQKFLYFTSRVENFKRSEILDEFLFALQNSKHAKLFEVPNFAEAICSIDLKVAAKFLESNVTRWTMALYEAILSNMEDVVDLDAFSKGFRKQRAKNNRFKSAIFICIYEGFDESGDTREYISNYLNS